MPTNDLQLVRFDALDEPAVAEQVNWLWTGYLNPGDITLLTSQWKTGKTTLITGMLRSLGDGTPFLGRETRPARGSTTSPTRTTNTATAWSCRR